MRMLLVAVALSVLGSCGSVSDTPLGGPYGGTTEPIPPVDDAGAPLDATPD
jgi:hypothetical protein